jgi:hypothetical protein
MHMSVKSTRENDGVTKERVSEHSDIAEKCTKILIGNIFLLCNILLKCGIFCKAYFLAPIGTLHDLLFRREKMEGPMLLKGRMLLEGRHFTFFNV